MFTVAAQIKTTIRYCQSSQRNLLLVQRILCLQKIYGRQFFDDRPKLHGHVFLHTKPGMPAGSQIGSLNLVLLNFLRMVKKKNNSKFAKCDR